MFRSENVSFLITELLCRNRQRVIAGRWFLEREKRRIRHVHDTQQSHSSFPLFSACPFDEKLKKLESNISKKSRTFKRREMLTL